MQRTNTYYFIVLVSEELPSKETPNLYSYQKACPYWILFGW